MKVDGTLILLSVELPGLFMDNGMNGYYCLLEWNDWNLYDDLTKFKEAFYESIPHEKHLLLVPINEQGLGDVVDISFPIGRLGVRINDHGSISLFNDLVDIYKAYKNDIK